MSACNAPVRRSSRPSGAGHSGARARACVHACVCLRLWLRACMRTKVRASVRASVHASVRASVLGRGDSSSPTFVPTTEVRPYLRQMPSPARETRTRVRALGGRAFRIVRLFRRVPSLRKVTPSFERQRGRSQFVSQPPLLG